MSCCTRNTVIDTQMRILTSVKEGAKERLDTYILLVGKTGSGKSATANSILGYQAFESRRSLVSVTKKAQFELGECNGRTLRIVDIPGITFTSRNTEKDIKLVIRALTGAIKKNPCGYHAILLTIKYGERFTNEDFKAAKLFEDIFGSDVFKNHAILLMTGGDMFMEDEGDRVFEEWIHGQEGKIKQLVKKCGGRVILFDNDTKDEDKKAEQKQKLMKIINQLPGNGAPFTNNIIGTTDMNQNDLAQKNPTIELNDRTMLECSLITQQVDCVDSDNSEKALSLLTDLATRAEMLEQNIAKQDLGSNNHSVAITLVQQLKKLISEKIKAINDAFNLKQQMEAMKHQMEATELELGENRKQLGKEKRKRDDVLKQMEQQNRQAEWEKQAQLKLENEIIKKQLEAAERPQPKKGFREALVDVASSGIKHLINA